MRIAQLTDPHIVGHGDLLHGNIDSGKRLSDAISVVNNMEPAVDVILLTGDLVEKPDDAAYMALQEILKECQSPVFLIPGNHDSRASMHAKFGDTHMYPCSKDCAQYDLNDHAVRLIALDSVWEGNELPEFGEDRADWLTNALNQEPNKPTLLFIHHPPFHTGIAFVDLAPSDWFGHLDPIADEILKALRNRSPEALTRTDISNLFKGHKKAAEIRQALDLLQSFGLAKTETQKTGGRYAEEWVAL